MKTHEFWREIETGDVWAVELRDGVVVACAGPLHWSEINPFYLDAYDYSAEKALSIEARRDGFQPLDEATLLMLATD